MELFFKCDITLILRYFAKYISEIFAKKSIYFHIFELIKKKLGFYSQTRKGHHLGILRNSAPALFIFQIIASKIEKLHKRYIRFIH